VGAPRRSQTLQGGMSMSKTLPPTGDILVISRGTPDPKAHGTQDAKLDGMTTGFRRNVSATSYCTGKQDRRPMTPGRACELASHQICFMQPKLRLMFLTYPPQSIWLTRGTVKEISVTASRTTCSIPDAHLSNRIAKGPIRGASRISSVAILQSGLCSR